MDEIFQDESVKGLKGAFTVVKVAREKPRRYGKNGELLIAYEDTEAYRRRSSIASQRVHDGDTYKTEGDTAQHDEEKSLGSK
jgi:hypothetical protein